MRRQYTADRWFRRAVDETFKKAPPSGKKHGHQKEFGL